MGIAVCGEMEPRYMRAAQPVKKLAEFCFVTIKMCWAVLFYEETYYYSQMKVCFYS
jgi:hypothetical protein